MKIRRIEASQLSDGTLGYKEYRKTLKPTLAKIKEMHKSLEETTHFIAITNFEFEDMKGKKMGLIVLGNREGNWKQTVKEEVKNNKSNTCFGDCYIKEKPEEAGTYTLVLLPQKGKAKKNLMIKQLLKFAFKGHSIEIEIGAGGELDQDDPNSVTLENIDLPEESNESDLEANLEAAQNGLDEIIEDKESEEKATGEKLELPEKVKLAAEHLRRGTMEADAEKKAQVITFLQKNVDDFFIKFKALHPADQMENEATENEYNIIQELLNKDKNRKPVMNVADLKTLAGGSSWGFKKTNFDKILDLLEQYQKAADHKVKHAKLQEINILIEEWKKSHPAGKRSKDEEKRFHGLMQLKTNIAPFIGVVNVESVDISIDDLNKGTAIIKEQAGSALASQRVKEVTESNIDERAKQLAILLDLGKAKNDDPKFGAVMKWLVDSKDAQLAAKYTSATAALFKGKKGVLISDISKVFGVNTLRTKFLIEYLEGNLSPYAQPALALGLLGNTWFDTSEASDAFEFIEKNLSTDEINTLLKPGTQNLKGTFEGAIAKKLQSDEKFKAQLTSIKLIKSAPQNKKAVDTEITAINGSSTKYKYVSAADYFLCATFDRIDDSDKFANELKKWVKKSSPEERASINEASAFYKLLKDKISRIPGRGISTSTASYLKSIISTYQIPPNGQESGKVVEQLQQIAARQKEKNSLSRWKQDKSVGDDFKKILFNEQVESPQEALIYKFCPDDVAEWNKGSYEKKREILDKAVKGLNKIMADAGISTSKVDEILETVYSDGARGEIYNKLKNVVKAKTNIGAATDIMKALEELSPDSKEIIGIKNDIELLKALKVKALQGTFKGKEDRERWLLAMNKLGIKAPTDKEIADAEKKYKDTLRTHNPNSTEEKKALADDLEKYELLKGYKEVFDPEITVVESVIDRVKDDFKRDPGRQVRNKILTKEQIAEKKAKETDLKKTAGYWAAKLAAEYKKGFTDRDDHRMVQLAYESKLQAVYGLDIMLALEKLSPNLHETIIESSFFDLGDSASILKKILVEGQKVSLIDMLKHAKKDAVLQRRVRLEDLTVMTDNISEAEIIKEWFDIEALKAAVETKKALLTKADAINAKEQKTPEDIEILDLIDGSLEIANNKIMQFDIKDELLKELDDSAKVDKVLKFKKILREKISAALINPSKSDELAEIFGNSITKQELELIGTSLKQVSNMEYEASLETGLQWSSLSSRMLQRDLAAAKNLKEGWQGRDRLNKIAKLSPEQRQEEEDDYVDKMNQTNTDLVLAQEKFVETKAKYDNRYKTAVSIVLTAILGAVAAVTGVGAGPFLIQLAWTMGSAFISTVVNEFVSKQIQGNNHRGMEDLFVNLITDQASSVLSLIGAQALNKLNWEVFLIGLEKAATGGDKAIEKICASSFRTIIEAVPQQFGNSITSSLIQTVNEKGSVTDRTLNDLKKFATGSLKNIIPAFLKNVVLNCDQEFKLIDAARGWLGGPFAPGTPIVADPAAKAKFVAKYEGVVQTKKYEEYFKSSGVTPSVENFGTKALTLLGTKVLSDLANEKITVPMKNAILENIFGKGIKDADLDLIIQNSGKGLRSKLKSNLAKHPDKITEIQVDSMELEEVRDQYAKLSIVHPINEIIDYISSLFNFNQDIWEAYAILTKLDIEKSLNQHADDYSKATESLESIDFRSDIITGKISKPYEVPNPIGTPNPLEKKLNLNQSIKAIFEEWESFQKEIALNTRANN